MKTYDVVIEVKNVCAENAEQAKANALDLLMYPVSADIKIEAFEKKSLDDAYEAEKSSST